MRSSSQPQRLPLTAIYWTIAAFAIAVTPHLMAAPIQISVAVTGIIIWRTVAARLRWKPLPAWIRILLTGLLLGLVVISFGGAWGRRMATALLCVMLAAKLMEMYRARDMRVVASVCFFLVATQFLFDERLIYFVYLIVGCWTATSALIQIQRIRMHSAKTRTRPLSNGESLRQSGRLLLLALPVTLALFVLFPRLAQPLWGMPEDALDGRTGLSETMSPGSIASLYADDSPAFRVEFESNTPPPPEQRYWRGPVLWRFDGTTWEPPFGAMPRATVPVPIDENAIRYEVQLEPHERRWLLALDYPAQSDHPRNRLTSDYQLLSRTPITSLTAYRVVSNPLFLDSPVLDRTARAMATRLPSDRNPRTLAMAQEWRQRYPDDQELVNALLRWFADEPFFYSLETLPLGRDGADEFLFDLRTGYCEYYASAFAIFMRAAGIPTRIVTGYQGGFWNEAGAYMLVRNSDAHAWAEVWLEGRGWTRVDPTAAVSPSRIQRGSADAIQRPRFMFDWEWASNLRNQFDRVQHLWNQWILGFDSRAQMNLLKRLGLPELSALQMSLLMLGVLLLISIPLGLLLLREATLRSRDPVYRQWRRLQRKISKRANIALNIADSPQEWSQRVQREHGPFDDELLALIALYQRVRYGPPSEALSQQFLDRAGRFNQSTIRR